MNENNITKLAEQIYADNVRKGFWDDRGWAAKNRISLRMGKSECISLIVSELGEAQEALRKPGPSEHIPEFSGLEEELADAMIRIMDMSAGYNLRLEEAIHAKLEFNRTRPHLHGKNS